MSTAGRLGKGPLDVFPTLEDPSGGVELRGVNPSTFAGEHPSGDDDVLRATRRQRSARSSGTVVRVEILIALLCSAVTLLGIVYLGAQSFDASPVPSHPQAKGIVWGGRTFVNLAEFARSLRSRGLSYEVWAQRHPTRAGIAPLQPPVVPQPQRAQPSGAGNRSTWTTLAGVAVVLAALGLLLGIRRRSWLPRMRRALTGERLAVAARGRAAAAAGARLILRLATVSARAAWSLLSSAALVLVVAAQGVAPAAAAGTRLMLRLATVAARVSSNWARAGAWATWRRRETLAWYVAAALLATISALAVTLWV
jgi:hypothetical protein